MHTKVYLFDECAMIMGSSNATHNSLTHNWEIDLLLRVRAPVWQMLGNFMSLWGNPAATEMTEAMIREAAANQDRRREETRLRRSASRSAPRSNSAQPGEGRREAGPRGRYGES